MFGAVDGAAVNQMLVENRIAVYASGFHHMDLEEYFLDRMEGDVSMFNLLHMDFYRVKRSKSVYICFLLLTTGDYAGLWNDVAA